MRRLLLVLLFAVQSLSGFPTDRMILLCLWVWARDLSSLLCPPLRNSRNCRPAFAVTRTARTSPAA
jgi:hypothetical protein